MCKEFNVNYSWLIEGIGDTPLKKSDGLDKLTVKNNLDEMDRKIVIEYMKLPKDARSKIKCFFDNIYENNKKPSISSTELTETILEKYGQLNDCNKVFVKKQIEHLLETQEKTNKNGN